MVNEQWRSMGRQMCSEFHHRGEFLHNYWYTFESVHDGDHDGVIRIFIGFLYAVIITKSLLTIHLLHYVEQLFFSPYRVTKKPHSSRERPTKILRTNWWMQTESPQVSTRTCCEWLPLETQENIIMLKKENAFNTAAWRTHKVRQLSIRT